MTFARFRKTVTQTGPGAWGADTMITLPSSQPDDDYGVFVEQIAGGEVCRLIPLDDDPSDRTSTQFRAVSAGGGPFPEGAVYEFMVVHA